jgi:hypothetical protein
VQPEEKGSRRPRRGLPVAVNEEFLPIERM